MQGMPESKHACTHPFSRHLAMPLRWRIRAEVSFALGLLNRRGVIRSACLLPLLVVMMAGSGCLARGGYQVAGKSGLNVQMPPPGMAKVVFIRPNPLYRDFQFQVCDDARLIGILPYKSFFQYECEPGRHRFSSTLEDDLKVIEADLAPGKIYYAKVAARYGVFSPGVNLYSLYPGCPGEVWPQLPQVLSELTETLVNADAVAEHVKAEAEYGKRLEEFKPSAEAEVIRPEHGQAQPIRGN
jgi:hypothetical protein